MTHDEVCRDEHSQPSDTDQDSQDLSPVIPGFDEEEGEDHANGSCPIERGSKKRC